MNILKDDVKKLYIKYFFPTVGAALVTSIYILFDTIFIGQGVGGDGLAALNIVLPIYSIVFGCGYLLGVGGSTVMGIEKGRGKEKRAREIFSLSIITSITVALTLFIICQLFMEDIAYLLGATPVTIDLIMEYMNVVEWGIIPFIIGATLQGFVRIDKAPKRAMVATITGGLINIILDYIFVFPLGMGMFGAALATVLSYTLSCTILLTHFISKNNSLKLTLNCYKKSYLIRIIKTGIPSFFVEISMGIVIFLFNLQLLRFIGDVGVTAYSIISNSAIIAVSIFNGICQTIQPLVSLNIGAKQKSRAMELRKIALTTAIIFGALYTLMGYLFPEQLINIFVTPTEEIVSIAVVAIRIYFIAFIVMGVNMVIGGYFQAIEMPKFAILLATLRGLIIVSILVFTLPLIFGVKGIWLSIPVTEVITLVIALGISRRKLHC